MNVVPFDEFLLRQHGIIGINRFLSLVFKSICTRLIINEFKFRQKIYSKKKDNENNQGPAFKEGIKGT